MKKFSSLLLMALFFGACQEKSTTTTNANTVDSTKYPYTLKKVQGWEINKDSKNALAALNTIKSFERWIPLQWLSYLQIAFGSI